MTPESSAGVKARLSLVRVTLSGVLLFLVLRQASLVEVLDSAREADLTFVVLAFLLYPVGIALSISRWRTLLHAQEVSATLPFLVRSYMSAAFWSNILPSTIGGDAYRMLDTWRLGASRATAAAVIMLDRFLGLMALLLLAGFGLAFSTKLRETVPLLSTWLLAIVFGLGLGVWLAHRSESTLARWAERAPIAPLRHVAGALHGLRAALMRFSHRRREVSISVALSIALQLNVVLHFILLAYGLDLPVPKPAFLAIVPITILVMMVPVTVNGIGIRENVFAFFLGLFQVPVASAIAFAWLAYGLQLLFAVLGGIVYLTRRNMVREDVSKLHQQ